MKTWHFAFYKITRSNRDTSKQNVSLEDNADLVNLVQVTRGESKDDAVERQAKAADGKYQIGAVVPPLAMSSEV